MIKSFQQSSTLIIVVQRLSDIKLTYVISSKQERLVLPQLQRPRRKCFLPFRADTSIFMERVSLFGFFRFPYMSCLTSLLTANSKRQIYLVLILEKILNLLKQELILLQHRHLVAWSYFVVTFDGKTAQFKFKCFGKITLLWDSKPVSYQSSKDRKKLIKPKGTGFKQGLESILRI